MEGSPIAAITGIELDDSNSDSIDTSAHVSTYEKQFEVTYGTTHIPFFHGTFEQAKRDSKIQKSVLMAVFTSRWHEGTFAFLKQLADRTLAQTLDNNRIICWPTEVSQPFAYDCKPLSFFPPIMNVIFSGEQIGGEIISGNSLACSCGSSIGSIIEGRRT